MIEPRFGHAESGFYFALFFLAFPSTFRNSGFAELTWHSEIKRKASFPFVFLSFFRNFAT